MYTCSYDRMKDKIETFSKFGDAGHGGITRYSLSPEAIQARNEFRRRMETIGATIEVDDVACMYATLPGSEPDAKRIVMGSHVDSVKNGGNRDTVYYDKKLVGYVKAAAEETGIKHQYIHSGAGHDAQFCAYMIPTTMVFVQSKDGLSHCEKEFSSVEHCTEGATVMLNAVLKADQD